MVSLEYPGKFLVHIAIDDQRHGPEEIVEANDTVAIPIEVVEHKLRVSGRIAKREQFSVCGFQVAGRRTSSGAQLLEGAIQFTNFIFRKSGATDQGRQLLGEDIQ